MLINESGPGRDRTAVVKQHQKTSAFLKGFRNIPGVKWWQLNCNPDGENFGQVIEVTFDQVNAGYLAGVQNRINVRPHTLYVPAINRANAERKFRPMIEDIINEGSILKYITQ